MHHRVGRQSWFARAEAARSKPLDPLPALPSIARFQRVPGSNTPSLYTHHLLVSIFRPEISHSLRFLYPWIPDYHVR